MLEVTALCLDTPNNKANKKPLSLSLLSGQILWITGENGAGKSTLLKTLLGLVPVFQGTIKWAPKRPPVFYLSHELGLVPELTVLEFCRWHPSLSHFPSEQACRAALQEVGLLNLAYRYCGHLSRGQQQRLLWACATLSQARLWVLDEPFTALDEAGRHKMIDILTRHREQGGSALVVSHVSLNGIENGVFHVIS